MPAVMPRARPKGLNSKLTSFTGAVALTGAVDGEAEGAVDERVTGAGVTGAKVLTGEATGGRVRLK